MSDTHNKSYYEYISLLENNNLTPYVGSILDTQSEFIQQFLLNNPNIKKVIEIGFNIGISSSTILSSRNDIHVISFDICLFDYMPKAKLLIDTLFSGRHTLIIGDSTKTIPTFFNNYFPAYQPDLVFIDGGHEHPIPLIDIYNICKHIQPGTFVIIDDYCESHGNDVMNAADEYINLGILTNVTYYKSYDRGWISAIRSNIEIPSLEIALTYQPKY